MIAVEGPAQGTNMGNMHALNTSSSVSGATTWFLSHRISLAHNIQNHGSRGRSESNRCKPNLETDLKSWLKNKTQHSLLAHQRPPGSHRWSSTDNPWPTAWVGPETGPAAHGQTNIWDVAAITRAAYKMYVFSSVHIMSFSSEHWLNDSKGSWIWKSNKSEHLCLSCISSFSPDSNHCFSIPTAHVTTVSLSSYFTGTRDFLMWGHSSFSS